MKFPGITGRSGTAFSLRESSELSINCWRLRVSGEDTSDGAFSLRRDLGMLPYIDDLPVGMHRGAFEENGSLYMVVDDTVFQYINGTQAGSYGPMADDGEPVYFASSGTSVMINSANTLYRINSGSMTVPAITVSPIGMAFLNNYFIIGSTQASQFYWSSDDGATWDALDFQTAEADANSIVQIAVINEQLWIIGNRTSEVYRVVPDSNAPFGAIEKVEVGTRAPASVKVMNDDLYMLESTREGEGSAIRIRGYTVDHISDTYAARKIQSFSTITDAIGQSIEKDGQHFVRWTFPDADTTLQYHVELNEWSETPWFDWHGIDGPSGTLHRHRAQWIIKADGKILCGDHSNGVVYEMSFDYYTDAGFPQKVIRRTPFISEENKLIFFGTFELGMETGVGLESPLWLHTYDRLRAAFVTDLADAVTATDVTAAQALILQDVFDCVPYIPLAPYPSDAVMEDLGFQKWGSDPQIAMRYSNDGGTNFSQELLRRMGSAGEVGTRVRWNRMGSSPRRVIEISTTDPVKLAITNSYIDGVEVES